MHIDITRLKSGIDTFIYFNNEVLYNKELAKNTDLIDLKNTKIEGKITKDTLGNFYLDCKLDGIMILPCAVTLKPVDYHFSTEITGNIEDLYEEIDKNLKKSENSIDILPIIWENILMEMPMRVVSDDLSDAKTSGDGWKIITEEEKSYVNPEFEKLKDLLK